MRFRQMFVVLAAVVLSGCYESEFPLDVTPQVVVNKALVGVWRCLPIDAGADEKPALLDVAASTDRLYRVTWTEDGSTPDRYQAYGSTIAIPRLLNLQQMQDGKPSGAWVFLRYTLLRPSVMELAIASDKVLKDVQKTPALLRQTMIQRQNTAGFFDDFAVCARTKG